MASSKTLLLLLLVLFSFNISSATSSSLAKLSFPASHSELSQLFEDYIQSFGKNYGHDAAKKQARFEIFKENVQYIQKRNREQSSYTLGLTRFTDITLEELKEKRIVGGLKRVGQRSSDIAVLGSAESCDTSALPRNFDWRMEGVVTPVKDQLECGNCWAFAAVATMESAYAIRTGKLFNLSEQELTKCVYLHEHSGCEGGFVEDAYGWVIARGGIHSQADDYPFMTLCNHIKVNDDKVVKISNYIVLPQFDEAAMLCALAQRPIAVAICANTDFANYVNGIFDGGESCPDEYFNLNHEVVLIGWGSDHHGEDYWIVKNSWGTSWGMKGYITIGRNTSRKRGICGMNNEPSYPLP